MSYAPEVIIYPSGDYEAYSEQVADFETNAVRDTKMQKRFMWNRIEGHTVLFLTCEGKRKSEPFVTHTCFYETETCKQEESIRAFVKQIGAISYWEDQDGAPLPGGNPGVGPHIVVADELIKWPEDLKTTVYSELMEQIRKTEQEIGKQDED